jgi:hypothetical protein
MARLDVDDLPKVESIAWTWDPGMPSKKGDLKPSLDRDSSAGTCGQSWQPWA